MTRHAKTTTVGVGVVALALTGTMACGDSGPGPNGEPANVPGTNLWLDPGDGVDRGPIVELRLSSGPEMRLEKSLRQRISVEGLFGDGKTIDLDQQGALTFSSSDPAIVVLGDRNADGIEVIAQAEGSARVIAAIGSLRAEQAVTVLPPSVQSIALTAEAELRYREVVGLTAVATFIDGSTRDVTAEAEWSSSTPDALVALNDAGRKGLVFAKTRGSSVISATLDDVTGTLDVAVACSIEPSNGIALGSAMVNASWPGAILVDAQGTKTTRALSIEEMMCDSAFDQYRGFIFSLNAGWCGPCHAWMRTVSGAAAQMEQAGILPVFIIGDTATRQTYAQSNTAYADQLVSQHVSDPRGLRIGDADTQGAGPNGLKQVLNTTQAWPSLFLVRRADMQVITLSAGAPQSVAPVIAAMDAAGGPGGNPTPSSCAPGVDEASEPNDVPRLAPRIGVGSFAGGICNAEHDLFRVRLDGRWRASIAFSNASVDLDLYAWDEENDRILTDLNGQPIQSISTRRDAESIEHEGDALIRVQPKVSGRTGTYTLTLEPL